MKFAPEFVEQGTAFAGKGYLLIPLLGATENIQESKSVIREATLVIALLCS